MKTVGEALRCATQFLQQSAGLRPRFSAEYLLAHLLQIKRLELYMQFDRFLEERQWVDYQEWIQRRSLGEPVEHITGEVEFYHCKLCVTKQVLIPRLETEILLDLACQEMRPVIGQRALDLCTGSGCIAIGLKKRFPQLSVTAVDLSDEALEVARANALLNQVDVEFLSGDLLEPIQGRSFNFVFCNPPYLSIQEHQFLHPEVKNFEPSMALIGGTTGLEFYKKLAYGLPSYLCKDAKAFLEIGSSQDEKLKKLFIQPSWKRVIIKHDWAKQARFLFLYCENQEKER